MRVARIEKSSSEKLLPPARSITHEELLSVWAGFGELLRENLFQFLLIIKQASGVLLLVAIDGRIGQAEPYYATIVAPRNLKEHHVMGLLASLTDLHMSRFLIGEHSG
jgi:hypothetical protein